MATGTDRFVRNQWVGWILIGLVFCVTQIHSINQLRLQYENQRDQAQTEQAASAQNSSELYGVSAQNRSSFIPAAGPKDAAPVSIHGGTKVSESSRSDSAVSRGSAFPYFIGRRTYSASEDRWQLIVMNSGNTQLFDVEAHVKLRTPSSDVLLKEARTSGLEMSLTIGIVQPATQGPSATPCFLPSGSYEIDITTRDSNLVELLDILVDPQTPGGFSEHYKMYLPGSSQPVFADGKPFNVAPQ